LQDSPQLEYTSPPVIACHTLCRRFTGGDLNPLAVNFTAARLLAEHAWPAQRQPQLRIPAA
jgi:hypothetical protein